MSGRRSRCQTLRSALTYVDRCMVPGLQLAEPLICVDTEITNSGHPSTALKDLLLICCTLFLKGHKSALAEYDSGAHCTTAACTCRPHPPQIRLGTGEDTVPAFLRGRGIHKVVKRLIRRLSSAPGQSCMSLTVSALIALWFVCYGSSELAMSQGQTKECVFWLLSYGRICKTGQITYQA